VADVLGPVVRDARPPRRRQWPGRPRIAAGGPLPDDILKCELKAIDQKAYTQPFTADQMARLKAAFPKGV